VAAGQLDFQDDGCSKHKGMEPSRLRARCRTSAIRGGGRRHDPQPFRRYRHLQTRGTRLPSSSPETKLLGNHPPRGRTHPKFRGASFMPGVEIRLSQPLADRQDHAKDRSVWTGQLHGQASVVGFDNRTTNGQAHPHASRFRCKECVEDAVNCFWINSRSGIFDRHQNGI
jgi:hypothetical protein